MNTDPLTHIPPAMSPWGLQLVTPDPGVFGAYHLVGIEQASIETHHQVEVIDEDGKPVRGVVVVFGFSSGPNINMPARVNHWPDAPVYLKGNAQPTNAMGYAQHTFGEGGEDIFIWDRNDDGDILYPSAIVRNCTWQRTPVARFEHTGVSLVYQLRRTNVIPAADRLSALEAWVTTFEAQLIKNTEALAAIPGWVQDVEARIAALEGGRESGNKGEAVATV